MDVKKEYMKLFSRNLFLNKEKSKKIKKRVSRKVDQVLSRYEDDRVAFNEELEPAIYRALRLTEENAEYIEDMGIINVIQFSAKVPHLNLKTRMKIGNLPLIHITSGLDPKLGDYNVAKGVVAIGKKAKGIIALGKSAYGLIAIGVFSIGILSFGGLSIGLFSAAVIALSILLSIGVVSISAIASLGIFAFSTLAASGQVAVGYFFKTADKISENIPAWFAMLSDNIGSVVLIFELIVLAVILIIYYFDYISRYNYRK